MMDRVRGLLAMVACAAGLGASTGCVALSEDAGGDDANEREDGLRVCPEGTTVEGIDVSYYQETVDWAKVAQSGRKFAFIRVSDGTKHFDSKFYDNWAGAKAAGLLRGAYQFFRPAQSAEDQADIMIGAIGQLGDGDLPPVIDVEAADGQSDATIVDKMRIWLQRVEAGTGRKPIIYAAGGFWNELSGTAEFDAFPLWVANYGAQCPYMPNTWSNWAFWQYSDSGSVSGVPGPVDVNVFNGTYEELQALALGGLDLAALEVGWERQLDSSYSLFAAAGPEVARVEYFVDGYQIGGALREDGESFPDTYTFNVEKSQRLFEAFGFDADDRKVARGIGLIDVKPSLSVFIRQTGEQTYEIGLERAPAEVAAIEVMADDILLTDGVTGTPHSTRLAVVSQFNTLGPRTFAISTFNADGSKRGTLYRTFSLE